MKKTILTVLVLCAAMVANAQSISEIELNQARAIWLGSGNAAGISSAGLLDFNDVSLNFEGQSGAFTHSYGAASQQDYSLKGRTVTELAGFKIAADLLLDRSSLKDAAFNSSIYEVNPAVRPYWFLDYTTEGYDWKRGNYAADVKVASPLLLDGRLAAGANIKVDAKTAAREADISASYSSVAIEFAPSAVFRIDEGNTVGAAIRFSNIPEKSIFSCGQVEEGVDVVTFSRGLGQYLARHINGVNPLGDVSYKNKYTGVSLQYDKNTAESDLLLDLGLTKGNSYIYGGERNLTAIDDISTDFTLKHLKGAARNRIFTLAAQYRQQYGYDNTFYSDIHTFESASVKLLLNYTVYFGAPTTTYSWFMGLRADASYLSQKRYLPDGLFKAPEVLPSMVLGKNTALGADSELMWSLRVGYHMSFGADYSFGTPKVSEDKDKEPEINLLSTMLYSDEYYFLKQYYYLAAPQVRYSTKVNGRLSAYALLQGSFIKPVEAEGARLAGGVSLGIIF